MDVRKVSGEKVELIPGMWYVGVETADHGPSFGMIAQYVGDGEFYDDDKHDPQTVDMRGYDYILEQNMGKL